MKKTLITIAFATASMFAAQNPAPSAPPAGSTEKPTAVKPKKAKKAKTKKVKKNSTGTTAPASK